MCSIFWDWVVKLAPVCKIQRLGMTLGVQNHCKWQGHLSRALAILSANLFAGSGGCKAQRPAAQRSPGLYQDTTSREIHVYKL